MPVEIIIEPYADEAEAMELFKSLSYMKDRFEFIERDDEGIKVRARTRFMGGEFPYEVGYVVVSAYDDRQFLVTKVDRPNQFVWFGTWEK